MKRRLALLVLLLGPAFGCHALGAASEDPGTSERVLYLVRHAEAEETTPENRDPGLTDRGRQRAEALAGLLAPEGVTHLMSSPYARTQQTLAPLASALGLEPMIFGPVDYVGLEKAIGATPEDAVIVVAGHSNTVPALLEHLGGDDSGIDLHQGGPERRIHHDRYDRLFRLALPNDPDATPSTVELALP